MHAHNAPGLRQINLQRAFRWRRVSPAKVECPLTVVRIRLIGTRVGGSIVYTGWVESRRVDWAEGWRIEVLGMDRKINGM